jgi:indolepyruvate decarboxylase
MSKTVIEHVLSRLQDIGIRDVLGVAGDFAFPINDAVVNSKDTRWVGSCNELNAAYSADGYARSHGIAALCTTYGVGELSAMNGVAGAYAENLPIFLLVGMPASRTQAGRRLVHHTLGNGEFELFYKMAEPVVCARTIMTPENCAEETERLIAAALYHRRPVYMAFPTDYATSPVIGTAQPRPEPKSDSGALSAATKAILAALSEAKTACVLPGNLVSRIGLTAEVQHLIMSSNLPFATMFWDKSALDETLPNYVGMYDGKLMNEEVRAFVEGSDLVLGIGAVLTDFNAGSFTAKIERSKSISADRAEEYQGAESAGVGQTGWQGQRSHHGRLSLCAMGTNAERGRRPCHRDRNKLDGPRLRANAEGDRPSTIRRSGVRSDGRRLPPSVRH